MINKRHLTRLTVAAALCAAGAVAAVAVPAYPGKIKTVQPNGTEITIRLHGDENRSWAETEDGYTLLLDSEGYWSFAKLSSTGAAEVSGIRYTGSSRSAQLNGITPGIKAVPAAAKEVRRANDSGLQVDESFPAIGNHRLLMLLVNYSDTQPVYSQANFNSLMNAEGYNGIGSFRDYYLENSYGKLDITTTVTRWVTLPYPKSYYGADGAVAMIRDALTLLDDEINLAEFDNNSDGILDGLAVIHQGAGREYTGAAGDIWSHSSAIYGMEFDGIQVRRYTIEPELLGTTGISTIGVVCHEFGHNLGAPDFYDTDYESSGGDYCGTGVWDLLGSGAWNGNRGDRPAGINMWQKIQLGWAEPTILTADTQITGMQPANTTPEAYRVDTTVPGEYFILENRQQTGAFDAALPGHGMIVYHVDEEKIRQTVIENTLNATFPQAIYTVCSSAGNDPSAYASSFGNVNSDEAPFPGRYGITEISDETLPSLKSISGRNSYKKISEITETTDGTISFTYTNGDVPAIPDNFTATAERGVVNLSWQLSDATAAADIDHFTLYRNGTVIATTQEYHYEDNEITDQTAIDYYVDATYANGLTSPYAMTSIMIPANHIKTAAATETSPANVTLTWQMNTMLTRIDNKGNFDIRDYNVSSLDYVQRFTADDLSTYRGYKIRKIGFMPYQGPSDISIKLRVWEADDDGSNPRMISERTVKEFGRATWNDILLSSSVEITGDKQLWIGLHCETTTGCIQIINDRAENGHGMGNWIKMGGGQWQEDATTSSSYYLRFTLAAPSADPEHEALTIVPGITEMVTDLVYPIGFSVYRDNELLGYVSGRCFVDNDVPAGEHTYSISNLYKGHNESVTTNVNITTTAPTGIDGTISETAHNALSVNGNNIALPGYTGRLAIYDIFGRTIYSGTYDGRSLITLQAGIYLVKTGNSVEKIIIK